MAADGNPVQRDLERGSAAAEYRIPTGANKFEYIIDFEKESMVRKEKLNSSGQRGAATTLKAFEGVEILAAQKYRAEHASKH